MLDATDTDPAVVLAITALGSPVPESVAGAAGVTWPGVDGAEPEGAGGVVLVPVPVVAEPGDDAGLPAGVDVAGVDAGAAPDAVPAVDVAGAAPVDDVAVADPDPPPVCEPRSWFT